MSNSGRADLLGLHVFPTKVPQIGIGDLLQAVDRLDCVEGKAKEDLSHKQFLCPDAVGACQCNSLPYLNIQRQGKDKVKVRQVMSELQPAGTCKA